MDKESLEHDVMSKGVFVAGSLWKMPIFDKLLVR